MTSSGYELADVQAHPVEAPSFLPPSFPPPSSYPSLPPSLTVIIPALCGLGTPAGIKGRDTGVSLQMRVPLRLSCERERGSRGENEL